MTSHSSLPGSWPSRSDIPAQIAQTTSCSCSSAPVPTLRWSVSVHLEVDGAALQMAFTLAESVAYDGGDRARAVALARVVVDHSGDYTTITFTIGPARDRAAALDVLRTHLGRSASDLDRRNWSTHARIMRAVSAQAK
jgi:hypothetical protein